jgi:hypothetical protein
MGAAIRQGNRAVKGMRCFSISDPVFKTKPMFVLGCSAREAESFLRARYRFEVNISPGSCGTMLTLDRFPWRVVWCEEYPDTPKSISTLFHEVFHLVVRICGDKGIPIVHHIETGECGDEAAAYLFEFFAQECLLRTRRRKVIK